MARILVIDGEPGLRKSLEYSLQQAGFECLGARSGAAGVAMTLEQRPSAVLLDWGLPDVSGADVCRLLKSARDTRDIPIVFVSARGDEADRVLAFELGAADYVVKPFSMRELMLRLRAVMRRAEARRRGRIDVFGSISIDEDAHRVWVDGAEAELTLLEWKLLIALFQSRDRVQTRDSLLDRVWGADVSVTTRTVDTHVKRLRDKLGVAGDYVETVRGIGYRFAAAPKNREGGEG